LRCWGIDEAAEGLDQDVKEGATPSRCIHTCSAPGYGRDCWAQFFGSGLECCRASLVQGVSAIALHPSPGGVLRIRTSLDILFSPYGTLGRVFVRIMW